MGYKILDCKRFLRLEDKYIPFILSGCNNCHDFKFINGKYKEVREKNWSVFNQSYNKIPLFSREEIITAAKRKTLTSDEFYYTKGRFQNGDEFKKMIVNGLRSAYTIEELNEISNIPVSILISVSSDKTQGQIFTEIIHSSEQLKKYFSLSKVNKVLSEPRGWIYMRFSRYNDPLMPIFRKPCYKGLNKPVINKKNDFFYIFSIDTNNSSDFKYVCSLKGKGTSNCFSNDILDARQFNTHRDALNYLEKHKTNFMLKIGYAQ